VLLVRSAGAKSYSGKHGIAVQVGVEAADLDPAMLDRALIAYLNRRA